MVQPTHTPPNPDKLKAPPKAPSTPPGKYRIHFKDEGQDFLYFILDSEGMVLDAQPFQGWHWSGRYITNLRRLLIWQQNDKMHPNVYSKINAAIDSNDNFIRYPVIRVETL